MERIGDFFKRAVKEEIRIAPKIIDVDKNAVSTIASDLPQNKHKKGLNNPVNFTEKVLNKADQLVIVQQTVGMKGLINAGVEMIKRP